MGKLRAVPAAVLFLTVLFAAGCTTPKKETLERRAVARYLAGDALEYSFISSTAWKKSCADIDRMLDGAVPLASDAKARRELVAGIFLYRLLWSVSGAESINCIGRSSGDLGNGFIQERMVLLTDPDKPGLLRDLPGTGTIDPEAQIRELPEGTKFALYIDVKPVELLKALDRCGEYGDHLMSNLPAGLPVKELISGTNGIWSITVADKNVKDPIIRFELPDKEQRLFNLCALLLRKPDALKKGIKRLEFPGLGVVSIDGTRLTIYVGRRSEKFFKEAKKFDFSTLKPELFSALPKQAIAVGFIDAKIFDDATWKFGNRTFPSLLSSEYPEVMAISRLSEESGLLITNNGSSTILSSDLSLILEVILPWIKEFSSTEVTANQPTAKQAPAAVRPPVKTVKKEPAAGCSCAAVLHAVNGAFKANPALETGLYQLKNGKLVPVANGKYDAALFKISAADPRLPMWISAPHGSGFCVLTADGKRSSFKLAKPESFRRVIGFLHTIYEFDEDVFRQLIQAAGNLDRKQRK